jgi:hypothetical protein
MRTVLGYVSMLALGLMLAVVLAFVTTALATRGDDVPMLAHGRLDHISLLLGLVLGIAISGIARVHWASVPRRLVAWLLMNEYTFYQLAVAALLLAVIVLY